MQLVPAHTPDQLAVVRQLFREYADEIQADLCFQGFQQELAGLPGKYAPPRGCLLLACDEAELAGCVALRPLDGETCEMKRLYVRPAFRGTGLGRQLAQAVIARARAIGYRRMRLDTLRSMTSARTLYATLGFVEIPAYYENPLPGPVYLELNLRPNAISP
jgi:GNAT superfamily N-acetyltransferase